MNQDRLVGNWRLTGKKPHTPLELTKNSSVFIDTAIYNDYMVYFI